MNLVNKYIFILCFSEIKSNKNFYNLTDSLYFFSGYNDFGLVSDPPPLFPGCPDLSLPPPPKKNIRKHPKPGDPPPPPLPDVIYVWSLGEIFILPVGICFFEI